MLPYVVLLFYIIMQVKQFSYPPRKANIKTYIHKILAYIYCVIPVGYLFCYVYYFFRNHKKYRYEVSLHMIFKDEARYLREWLEYYLLIGVEHFYLYNNNSEDNYLDILQSYIDKGLVTLIEWPKKYAQKEAWMDCYRKYRHETHWLGCIDADEFVNLQKHNNIKDFLFHYRRYPSVLLHWRNFGTSGYENELVDYLVTERYIASWSYLCVTGKSFINNDFSFHKLWYHMNIASVYGLPIPAVNDVKCFVFNFLNLPLLRNYTPRAYINHYWSKSREFFNYKFLIREDADKVENTLKRKNYVSGYLKSHELNNITHDYSIQRWLIFLRENLKEVEKSVFQ